nr:MFS transporter [Chloroflexota bacterium]
ARTAAYLLGPPLGGAVLLYTDPRTAWFAVGVLGCLGFIPAAVVARGLKERWPSEWATTKRTHFYRSLAAGARDLVIVRLGIAQIALYASLRANSAFLPFWAIAHGMRPSQIGLILGGQVLATLLAQPVAGRLSGKLGERALIGIGLILVGSGLIIAGTRFDFQSLSIAAIALGIGEAAIAPIVSAAATRTTLGRDYGGRLGLLEATDNIGKVLGPLAAGVLIATLGHTSGFVILAGVVATVSVVFFCKFELGTPARES